jgi:uncharacterized Zn ribbon protein
MEKCRECQEEYEREEMKHNLCEDCFADFQSHDLEYQIEKAMHYAELRNETKPD